MIHGGKHPMPKLIKLLANAGKASDVWGTAN
jgi:hypothetical protein